MKSLNKHIYEKLESDPGFRLPTYLTEAATGVVLSSGKNLSNIIAYLDENLPDKKCIIPDSDAVRQSNMELSKWFCGDDISDALFFLKSNGSLCMYEPKVVGMSDSELAEYSITRKGEDYYLPNIKAKLQPTSKRLNSAKTDLKVWPDEWNRYIVKGQQKVDETAKMPTTVIDFKNQGAYVLNDTGSIRSDLHKSFSKIFGDDSPVTEIFANDDFKSYMSGLDKESKTEVSSMMANVISEPLAIVALLTNADGVQDMVRRGVSNDDLGELYQIIIPIRQNWPVADFYAHFKNLPDRLVAISVKSNGAGNSSTIMGCLPVAEIGNVSASSSDAEALVEFFNTTIPMFGDDDKVVLRIPEELSGKIQNLSLYALSLLKEQCCDSKTSNADRLVNTFSELISLTKKDRELYNQLKKICDLKGTNTIEKFLVCLFNANPTVINIIRKAVADATSCFKLTVNNNGNVTCTKQSPEGGTFRLIAKAGGLSLNFDIEDRKIVDVKKGHKTTQGQWIGFTFH